MRGAEAEAAPRTRRYSIVRNLSVALSLSVAAVSIIVILFFSVVETGKLEAALKDKASSSLDYLAKILELPLWNLDDPTIRIIGEAFAHDEDVAEIQIRGLRDELLFAMRKPGAESDVRLERGISRGGQGIGKILAGFSRQRASRTISGMIENMAIISCLVILSVFLATTVLIRLLIKKPLDAFSDLVQAFASEDYAIGEGLSSVREFQPFELVLRRMGREILSQLGELRELNSSLEENFRERELLFARVNASELRYRSLFATAQDAIFVMEGGTGRILDENQAARDLYGFSERDFESMTIFDVSAEPEKTRLALENPGIPVPLRNHKKKDGSVFQVEVTSGVFRQGSSDIQVGFVRDISARIRAEGELRNALEEKEALLRELYHRTKNNMQVICALIALQSDYIDDEGTKGVFLEIENRIHSMSLVHEKLYESQNLSKIGMGDYVRDLADLIFKSYNLGAGRIGLEYEVDDLQLAVDAAIPCGLILNELIANAFKHAFPGGRSGTLAIGLREAADRTISLRVADDGIGLPAGFDFRKEGGMGFKTVISLGEGQLRGTVSAEEGEGTAFIVAFRLREAEGRSV